MTEAVDSNATRFDQSFVEVAVLEMILALVDTGLDGYSHTDYLEALEHFQKKALVWEIQNGGTETFGWTFASDDFE